MPHIQDITGTDYDTLRALLGAWCAGRGAVRGTAPFVTTEYGWVGHGYGGHDSRRRIVIDPTDVPIALAASFTRGDEIKVPGIVQYWHDALPGNCSTSTSTASSSARSPTPTTSRHRQGPTDVDQGPPSSRLPPPQL